MTNLIDIYEPYLPFISFLTVIIINTFLILKGANWINIIIANVIITITMNFIGLEEYDFISIVLTTIIDILISIIGGLLSSLIDFFKNLFELVGDSFGSFWDWLIPW